MKSGRNKEKTIELISNVLLVHGWRLRMESMSGEKFILCCMKI